MRAGGSSEFGYDKLESRLSDQSIVVNSRNVDAICEIEAVRQD